MKYTHNYMKIFLDTADTEIIKNTLKRDWLMVSQPIPL